MLYLGSLCLVACAESASQLLPCGLLQDSTVLFNPRTSLLVQKIHCQPRTLNSACLGTVKTRLYIVEMFENSSVYYEVWRNPAWQLFVMCLCTGGSVHRSMPCIGCHLQRLIKRTSGLLQECHQELSCLLLYYLDVCVLYCYIGTGARFGSTSKLHLHLLLVMKLEKKIPGGHPARGPP